MFNQLGVIGCGLIGGSFALALKRAKLVDRVVGYSKSPSTTDKAKRLGVIDIAVESALQAVAGSDIVLIAVPVSATESTLRAIFHLVDAHTLIMDVGSTKVDVVDADGYENLWIMMMAGDAANTGDKCNKNTVMAYADGWMTDCGIYRNYEIWRIMIMQ